jgi:hypothetical protein
MKSSHDSIIFVVHCDKFLCFKELFGPSVIGTEVSDKRKWLQINASGHIRRFCDLFYNKKAAFSHTM